MASLSFQWRPEFSVCRTRCLQCWLWWDPPQDTPPPPLLLFASHSWCLAGPLQVAFKYQLLWVLLKYFISAHLSLQGWPLTQLCCHYLTWITSKGRLPWRSCIQLNQIWLLYLIKCSLKRKSHRDTGDEGHSHVAMMCSRLVSLPDYQPLLLCHESGPCLVLLALIPAVVVNAYILGGEGVGDS